MNIKARPILLVGLAIILTISLFLAPSLTRSGPGIVSASATDELTAAQRDTIIQIAEAYAEHRWTPTEANIWRDVKVSGNLIRSPLWEPGQEVTGVPYKWGGFSSLRPFAVSSKEDFDEGIAAGLSAGDRPEHDQDMTHELAVGVDCSGFVSRAWQLSYKRGSAQLKNLCGPGRRIAFTEVLRGDLLYKPGHVMLVGEDFDPCRLPEIVVYEASGHDWKVSRRDYTIAELTIAGYQAYSCPGYIFDTPTRTAAKALYAGAANPGVVYRYKQPNTWDATSLYSISYRHPNGNRVNYQATLEIGHAVLSLVDYRGYLYAGTMETSNPRSGTGRVYRLHTWWRGSNEWHEWLLVADNLDDQVSSLVVYNDSLYAGTSWRGGRLYNCEGTFDWTRRLDHTNPGGWSGFRSAHVWSDGLLYLGDIRYDIIGRYDGADFQHITHLSGSCIWDFASYDGELYASAWRGRLFKSSDGISWESVVSYGLGTDMWALEVFNDSLYMGLDDGMLMRYAGIRDGVTIIVGLWTEPEGNGILSMAVGPGNRLFLGVGGEAGYYGRSTGNGIVYAYDGKKAPQRVCTQELGTGVQVLYNVG